LEKEEGGARTIRAVAPGVNVKFKPRFKPLDKVFEEHQARARRERLCVACAHWQKTDRAFLGICALDGFIMGADNYCAGHVDWRDKWADPITPADLMVLPSVLETI
jgi:hypothetical protein